MNKKLAFSIALALVLLAGCATPAPEPTATSEPIQTPEVTLATNVVDIVNLWTQSGSGARSYILIDADDTMTFARATPKNLQDQPYWIFQILFEGTKLFIKPTISVYPHEACANSVAIYEVQLLEHGNIKIVMIEDECQMRVLWLLGEWEPFP